MHVNTINQKKMHQSKKRGNRSWESGGAIIKRLLRESGAGGGEFWREFIMEQFKPYPLMKSRADEVLFSPGSVLELTTLVELAEVLQKQGLDLVFVCHSTSSSSLAQNSLKVTAVPSDSHLPQTSRRTTDAFVKKISEAQQRIGPPMPLHIIKQPPTVAIEPLDSAMAMSFGCVRQRVNTFKRDLGDGATVYKYEMGDAILLSEVIAIDKKQQKPFKIELQIDDNKMVLFVTSTK